MYGKHFASMYTGSMFGAGPTVFAVWGYCIATARDGTVELNPLLLSPTLGCPVAEVEEAIAFLSAPDPRSRSKKADGRRLIRQGEFLYSMPTHGDYRGIKNDEDRRAYMREYMRVYRGGAKPNDTNDAGVVNSDVKHRQPPLAQSEADTEAEAKAEKKETTPAPTALVHVNGNGSLPKKKSGLPARRYADITTRIATLFAEVEEGGRRTMQTDEIRELQAELVFAYWAAKLNHLNSMLDRKRVNCLKARLRENSGNVHELLYAVDGARRDDYLMGRANNSRGKYDGIETLFRDRGMVERLAGLGGFDKHPTHPQAEKYEALVHE